MRNALPASRKLTIARAAIILCGLCTPVRALERPYWWDGRWQFRKLINLQRRQGWQNENAFSGELDEERSEQTPLFGTTTS